MESGMVLRVKFRRFWIAFFLIVFAACTDSGTDENIRALSSEDPDVRRSAAESFVAMGSTATESLIPLLGEKNPVLRKEAAYILGAIGDAESIDPLIGSLEDRDSDVRLAATWALVKVGAEAVPPLIEALGSGREEKRMNAEVALAKIGGPAVPALIDALGNGNLNIRKASVRVLGRIGDPRCIEPIKRLREDPDDGIRGEAASALESIVASGSR